MARTLKAKALPGTSYSLVSVEDLTGGLDLRRSATLMAPNRARQLRNWSLEEPGALRLVPGWSTHATTSLGAGRVQGGQRVYLADVAPFTLAAFAGSVYKPSDAGVWNAAVLAGRHATNLLTFVYDRTLVAVLDAFNVPRKSTDGATWSQLGIDAPSVAPTASAVAGGSLTAGSTYEFSYSYQDDDLVHYGNESATVQQAMAGANLTARVAVTASADAQVDTIILWARNVTAGDTVRRRVTDIPNATTTIDVTAVNWTSATEAPTDRDVPPALAFGAAWKNRWWARHATITNRIHFTQIFENQSWPDLFYIDIPFERGDEIAAIVPQGDVLLVFGRSRQVFLIIGQTSLDFEVRPSAGAEAGIIGPLAWAAVEGGVIHAAVEGIYIFDGATDRLLSYDIDPGWKDMVDTVTAATLYAVPMVYHRARKEVRIAVDVLYPYGTAGEWVLDLNRTRLSETAAWTCSDRTIGGYVSWDGNESVTGNRGRLFSWSNTIGRLYEEATGTSADGADLTAIYEGPAIATGLQKGSFTEVHGQYKPGGGTFGLEVLIDGISVASPTIDVSGGLDRYGEGVYGTATYGGASRKPFVQELPLEAEGYSAVVKAQYTGQDDFQFFAYALQIAPETAIGGIL